MMLSLLLLLPLLSAILVSVWPQETNLRLLSQGCAAVLIGWTLYLLSQFQPDLSTVQFSEFLVWLPNLNLNYSLAVDGLSMPLLVLSNVLTWIAIASTPKTLERPRLYYALIFLVNIGVSGSLMAQNLLLFFLFYE